MEIQDLRVSFQDYIHKLKARYEEDCRQVEEDYKKQINAEKAYILDCIEIEIGKLKQDTENAIDELNRSRYKELPALPGDSSSASTSLEMKNHEAQIEKELEEDKKRFLIESQDRRDRFEAQMKKLLVKYDAKRIEFLKKEIVPLVESIGPRIIADEAILESRHDIKITRNAICSGLSWALYNIRMREINAVCRVCVLSKIPTEFRKNLPGACKCLRFLCQKSPDKYFLRLYDIFATDQKLYVIMEEYKSTNLNSFIYRVKMTAEKSQKCCLQIYEALNYMHLYAIAHLNVKPENVIFDYSDQIRLVGFTRAFCYFDLDQERIIKAPKVLLGPYNDHLPRECFIANFDPCLADVWSFGLLIYEMATKTNPAKFTPEKKKSPQKAKSSENVVKFLFKEAPFNFSKIPNSAQRILLEALLAFHPLDRPRFESIFTYEYLQT